MQDFRRHAASAIQRWEAPTWTLVAVIYGGWLTLTFCWHTIPLWCAAALGAWVCAWHMSLQHELIHGHPTRHQRINDALAAPPLNLWLPYPIYRASHLLHHRDAHLTDPLEDPESSYMTPDAWAEAGPVRRAMHRAYNTLAGRVLLGPAWTIALFWLRQARGMARPDAPRRAILGHVAWMCLILGWVWGVCRIDPITYMACFVYPGTALILVRSLAEHRAAERPEDRTAVVEKAGLLGLLYLNNNLHVLHHERPSIPWFALPAHWRQVRIGLLGTRQGPVYANYREVAARYGLRPPHSGPHPFRG